MLLYVKFDRLSSGPRHEQKMKLLHYSIKLPLIKVRLKKFIHYFSLLLLEWHQGSQPFIKFHIIVMHHFKIKNLSKSLFLFSLFAAFIAKCCPECSEVQWWCSRCNVLELNYRLTMRNLVPPPFHKKKECKYRAHTEEPNAKKHINIHLKPSREKKWSCLVCHCAPWLQSHLVHTEPGKRECLPALPLFANCWLSWLQFSHPDILRYFSIASLFVSKLWPFFFFFASRASMTVSVLDKDKYVALVVILNL